jgi:Tol biopolymer transport system component/DNA-binding winged helix-turn-helix (wHTH) protein
MSMAGKFRILEWVVQPELNRMGKGDESIHLEPKIMQVLVELAESQGEVVSRDALLEKVWEGTFVSDDVLTRSVVELRKIFGDDSRNPRVIETIPKKGYRLIPPVESVATSATTPPVAPSVPSMDIWIKRAVGLAILFVAALGSLALIGYFRASTDLDVNPPRVFPLTSSAGNEYDPAVSPDGNQVAFVWSRDGEEAEDIYIRQLQSETPFQLTNHPAPDRQPEWSPDGQRIAFIREEGSACNIYIVPSLGGSEKRLAPCGNTRYPGVSWSPDGGWLALATEDGGQLRLELVSVTTPERRELTAPPEAYWGDHTPTFSPDGQSVAFIRAHVPGIEDIYIINVDGGEPRRVTFDNRDVTGLEWSPVGESIVFSSNRAGTYSLWRVHSEGGEPDWITGGGMKLKDPAVAQHMDRIAFENWVYEINIWEVNPSGEAERLIASTQWDRQPQFSPDGERIAFVSTRSGHAEIWTSDAGGENLTQLTSLSGPHTSQPRWSPDGDRLVFVSRPEGQADLYIVETSGAPPRRLTAHPLDEMAPSWSADGKWIYFGSRRSGSWEVWKVPSSDGEAQQVTTRGGYAAFETPDGAWIHYIKSDVPGIWRMPVAGGEETLLVEGPPPEGWGSWVATDVGVFYMRSNGSEIELAFHDLDSGATSAIALVPDFIPQGLTVSPNGRRILFAQIDRHECDVMIGDGLMRSRATWTGN